MTAELGRRECALCGADVVPVDDGWAHLTLRYVGFGPGGPRWAPHDHPATPGPPASPPAEPAPAGPVPLCASCDRPITWDDGAGRWWHVPELPFPGRVAAADHVAQPVSELPGRVCPMRPDLVVCHVCGPEHCREAK